MRQSKVFLGDSMLEAQRKATLMIAAIVCFNLLESVILGRDPLALQMCTKESTSSLGALHRGGKLRHNCLEAISEYLVSHR